jgi:hypothetical protein
MAKGTHPAVLVCVYPFCRGDFSSKGIYHEEDFHRQNAEDDRDHVDSCLRLLLRLNALDCCTTSTVVQQFYLRNPAAKTAFPVKSYNMKGTST